MTVLTSLLITSSFLYYLSLAGYFLPELTSRFGVFLFAVLAASIYGTGQYMLNEFVRQISKETSTTSRFSFSNLMFIATRIVFYVTALFMAIIVFQALTSSQYNVALYVNAIALSYLLAATISGILGYKFLSWSRVKRNISTLIFAASFLIALTAFSTAAVVNTIFFYSDDPSLTEEPYLPLAGRPEYYDSLKKNDELAQMFQLSWTPMRLAFFAFWASAVLLVRNYSRTIGKLKFWAMASLPAIAFFVTIIDSYLESDSFSPIVSAILPPIGIVSGGVFLAIIFLSSAKTLKQKGQGIIAHFLIITAFSFILGYAAVSPSIHLMTELTLHFHHLEF